MSFVSPKYVEVEYISENKTAYSFRGATYKEIKEQIEKKKSMKVSSLNILQTKDESGFDERENYNKGNDGKVPVYPEEKRQAILEAFKYFKMI